MVDIPCGWSYGPGWINCASILPEQIHHLSLQLNLVCLAALKWF